MPGTSAPDDARGMTAQPIWVTEHYWPGVADELVLAQAQRLARVADWWGTIVLPGQQTVFGLFLAEGPDEVRAAVARVAAPSVHVTAGLVLSPRPLVLDRESR
jgi:hypothetical protein